MKTSLLLKTAAIATATLSALTLGTQAIASVFGQQSVDQSRFIAVAQSFSGGVAPPLLIIEQVSNSRECWSESGSNPVRVDPLLVNFDFTGICGRSTDSNGYSIRVGGEDIGLQYTLRIVQRNGNLVLLGVNTFERREMEIGRTNGIANGFNKIVLNPGWQFAKRTYNGQTLGHVYLANTQSLTALAKPIGSSGTTSPPPVVTTPPPVNVSFADTRSDIYAQEIEQAVALGFVSGFREDNTFRPQVALTREQLVSMVIESLKNVPGANINIPTTASSRPYFDVEASRWSAPKIQWARDNNIISGYQDQSFRPAQTVTRAEMMAVLRRAAEYGNTLRGRGTNLTATRTPTNFSDTQNHWAASLISDMSSYCQVASPLNESGTQFFPNSPTLRNYAAAATVRMVNCVRQ
ncbi:DUF3747 domain-containing protein [Laspinema sp. A4]|uniref:DUF3747 domain-containing protein n=1 Tax=Laspinema sp. D2d TaxID=2953686 RepID=UPI0021BAB62E|nr:DUF3747 domain-containing protein [Laspinema sp. D2d]MCT7986664.1 DUF3747 domain-containing protein [Laspinema sp. D2d]